MEENELSPYTIVRNFEKLNEQWEENWQKECAVFKQHIRPRPDRVTASFFAPLPKPIPEHFTVLISRDTARNKACQTYSAYNTYWPEAYMDPTDYFLISKTNKHLRTNTLSELATIQENEIETQTNITYNKHKQTIYHCWTQPVFNFDQEEKSEHFCSPIQLDSETEEPPD